MSDNEKQAVRLHDRYNDDKADVTLVCSDDVSLKIHSYMLKANSQVRTETRADH